VGTACLPGGIYGGSSYLSRGMEGCSSGAREGKAPAALKWRDEDDRLL
jgi:hypothetical protein